MWRTGSDAGVASMNRESMRNELEEERGKGIAALQVEIAVAFAGPRVDG